MLCWRYSQFLPSLRSHQSETCQVATAYEWRDCTVDRPRRQYVHRRWRSSGSQVLGLGDPWHCRSSNLCLRRLYASSAQPPHHTHTDTHTHTLRLLSHPRDNNDIRTRTVGLMVEYQTRNWQVGGLSLTRSTTSNLELYLLMYCVLRPTQPTTLICRGKSNSSPPVGCGMKVWCG